MSFDIDYNENQTLLHIIVEQPTRVCDRLITVMGKDLDNVLHNLMIIARIPPHGKLRRDRQGAVTIQESSFWEAITRAFSGNNRYTMLEDLERIFKQASVVSKQYLEQEDHEHSLEELYQELKNSRQGINNLKTTYAADPTIVVKLERFDRKIIKYMERIRSKYPSVDGHAG